MFPSQVEHVLLELGMDPNYLILVDRKNNLDVMEVQVEMLSLIHICPSPLRPRPCLEYPPLY